MRIPRWFNLKTLSLIFYTASMLTPVLRFSYILYEPLEEPPTEELFGINALLFGAFPFLPWLTNITYLLIVFNRIPNQLLKIVLSGLNIYFALKVFEFKYYEETTWFDNDRIGLNVEVVYGFYVWLMSYIILSIELMKNFVQQKINRS